MSVCDNSLRCAVVTWHYDYVYRCSLLYVMYCSTEYLRGARFFLESSHSVDVLYIRWFMSEKRKCNTEILHILLQWFSAASIVRSIAYFVKICSPTIAKMKLLFYREVYSYYYVKFNNILIINGRIAVSKTHVTFSLSSLPLSYVQTLSICAGFEILTAITMTGMIFWVYHLLLQVSCLVYSSTLKMETICSSEKTGSRNYMALQPIKLPSSSKIYVLRFAWKIKYFTTIQSKR
jgi:hypothetical protein